MSKVFRNALVTGASSGIGRALSLALAKEGTTVFAAARRKDELDRLAEEAKAVGGAITGITMDVSRSQECVERVHALQREHGGLDLVVANAGVSVMGRPHNLTWAKSEPVALTNFVGACAVLTAAIADMVERKQGTLAGVSSIAGQYGLSVTAMYSATKAGLSTYLQGLRPDLRAHGIRVVDIRPGFVRTAMTADNTVPMPLAMSVDDAVKRMLAGLKRGSSVVAFPAPIAGATWLLRQLPNGVADAVNARLG